MDIVKQLFDDAGSDKASSHAYHNVYTLIAPYIHELREGTSHIMEIGYETGAGTYALSKMFWGFNFISLDIDWSKDKYTSLTKPRFDKLQCNTANTEDVGQMASYLADINFALIIDDGSHLLDHQQRCLEAFWPLLSPGGLYVIEDVFSLVQAYQFKDWPGFVVMDTRAIGQTNDLCVVLRKPYDI